MASVSPASPFVVRGDVLDPGILRADAMRFFRRYPGWRRYGVSAYAAMDNLEVDAICEAKLERFAAVAVIARDEIERRGILVVPTFRGPHVTLAHEDLETLIDRLATCEHRSVPNRHHRQEGG